MLQYVRIIVLVLALVLTSWYGSTDARSQGVFCAPREAVLEALWRKYEEFVVVSGVTSIGWMFELFSNPTTTTWTAVITSPSNRSCAIASGDGIRYHAPPQNGREIHGADVY